MTRPRCVTPAGVPDHWQSGPMVEQSGPCAEFVFDPIRRNQPWQHIPDQWRYTLVCTEHGLAWVSKLDPHRPRERRHPATC